MIIGVDERKFLEADKLSITNHIIRLKKHGIKERLLSKEGDILFFEGEQSAYRWMPENMFSPTPIIIIKGKKLHVCKSRRVINKRDFPVQR